MSESLLNEIPTARAIPALGRLRADLGVLRSLLEYLGTREVVGTIELEHPELPRAGHVLTLADGEHIVLLALQQCVCHWDASREPLQSLRDRVCQWLAEAPSPEEKRISARQRAASAAALPSTAPAMWPIHRWQVHKPDEVDSLARGGEECGEDL